MNTKQHVDKTVSKKSDLAKAAKTYKAQTGVCGKKWWNSWRRWISVVKLPWQACATIFFSIPKNVTSERPTVLMPTMIRWWEALRAPEVVKWQYKHRLEWEVTDERNGGTQRKVWGVLMEMERLNGRAKAEDQGAVALVLDPAKAFERVSLPVVWAWATHFSFPRKMLRVLCRVFRAEASAVRRMCGGAAPDHHSHLVRVQVELLASTCRFARRTEVTKNYPPLELRSMVDDVTAILKE